MNNTIHVDVVGDTDKRRTSLFGGVLGFYLKVDKRIDNYDKVDKVTKLVRGRKEVLTLNEDNLCGISLKDLNYLIKTNASINYIINFLNRNKTFNSISFFYNNETHNYSRSITNNSITIYDENYIDLEYDVWNYKPNVDYRLSNNIYNYISTTENGDL